jgi:hypothetical protein
MVALYCIENRRSMDMDGVLNGLGMSVCNSTTCKTISKEQCTTDKSSALHKYNHVKYYDHPRCIEQCIHTLNLSKKAAIPMGVPSYTWRYALYKSTTSTPNNLSFALREKQNFSITTL